MVEIMINILIFLVMPITGFFVLKNFMNLKWKDISIKSLIMIALPIVANVLIYNSEY